MQKDLSCVCLPIYFNEPLYSLQKCFEDLEYSYLVDRAFEWGKWKEKLCEGKLIKGKIEAGSPAVLVLATSTLQSIEVLKRACTH